MALKLFDNPVVTKELRSRMRGSRAYWVLFAYLTILSLALFLSYLSWWNGHNNSTQMSGLAVSFTAGRQFFMVLFIVQAILISLIMPALTSGGISIEREQRTFELLRSTTLPSKSIVLGKLMSSLSFVGLLLTASLPLISICFLLGGVAPEQVVITYVLLLVDALVYGAVGLAWSASAASTAASTALAYGSLILYFVVTVPFAVNGIGRMFAGNSSLSLSSLNPVGAIVGAEQEIYYSWPMAAWVPALTINGLMAILAIVLTTARISDEPQTKAPVVKLSLFAFVAGSLFFIDGSPLMGSSPSSGALALAMAALVVLCVFVPPFVTGDAVIPEDHPRPASMLGKLFNSPELNSGFPTALLLTAMVSALSAWAMHLWRATYSVTTLNPSVPAWIAITLTGIVVGLSGLGKLLSVWLNNRWTARVGVYVATVLLMTVPYVSYSNPTYVNGMPVHTSAENWLYLCPLVAFQQMCYEKSAMGYSLVSAQPYLAFANTAPDWLVTTFIYGCAGTVFFAAASLIAMRRGAASRRAAATDAQG